MNTTGRRKERRIRPFRTKRGVSPIRKTAGSGRTFVPRLNHHLKPIIKEIGTPEDRPFSPDPFQIEALDKLQKDDVVVSVPTGAGKTYIAVKAMAGLLEKGGRAWYASPLKALSNSKFFEFSQRFGTEQIGLLTGDHKVNPSAPLIVGTTEILRNQLYDAMGRGQDLAADLVVLDEAHYLGDLERGVVWEEVVIYLPPRVRLLLLSATVANAQEIADWLSFVRRQKTATVISHERPVPLYPLFLFPDGELTPLAKGRQLFPQVKHFIQQTYTRRRQAGRVQIPFGRILTVLNTANLLPAIFFLKSRADCDLALSRCFGSIDRSASGQMDRLQARINKLLEKYPFLKTHPHLKYIRQLGIAAHHAGHLPHWKLVVEQLMQEGLLRAIFSTSTVAAGVNFPARTVVICQSDRFNGREFADLSATELLQMTGRAGRRGMDRIGFALIVPGPFQDVPLIHTLFNSSPEPVRSQMQINFSMVLNLLLSHRPEEVRPLLNLSLATFQQHPSDSRSLEAVKRITGRLQKLMTGGSCGGPEQGLLLFQRTRELKTEASRLTKARPRIIYQGLLQNALSPGRLFERKGGQIYCVIRPHERQGRTGVLAAKVRKDRLLKKGRLRMKWVPFERVGLVLATQLDLPPDSSPNELVRQITAAAAQEHMPLNLDRLDLEQDQGPLARHEMRLAALKDEKKRLACQTCPLSENCVNNKDSQAFKLLARLEKLQAQTGGSSRLLWSSFMRYLEFLRDEGFVAPDDELTEDGKWAAKLRLDHPLIIAAGIRARAWPEDDPALLAALISPFVLDNDKPAEPLGPTRTIPSNLTPAWLRLEKAVTPLMQRQQGRGFETPALNPRASLAIHSWATLGDWNEAVRVLGQDEGDLAMLAFRTADSLRQLASLADTQPGLAASARHAIDLILKEPVTVPL